MWIWGWRGGGYTDSEPYIKSLQGNSKVEVPPATVNYEIMDVLDPGKKREIGTRQRISIIMSKA